jgi:hypothetical protein
LITLAQHHDGERTATPVAASRFIAILVAGLAFGAAGCTQTTTQALSEPVVTAPIVLNSAPGAPVAPTALAPQSTTAAPQGTVAATASAPPPATVAPVAVAPAPVAAAPEPLPTAAPAAPEPLPTAAPAASTGGEFPNINQPPTQPAGNLLPEAERARIIAELEALRDKQDTAGGNGGGGGNAAALAEQADTHGQAAIKQIEACSEEGALQNNPDCAPAD